ncbi:hypothetical protein QUA56_25465 [Microcoleus sp. N3A4]
MPTSSTSDGRSTVRRSSKQQIRELADGTGQSQEEMIYTQRQL